MKFMVEITDKHTKMETACTLSEMLTAITMIIHDTWEHLPNNGAKDLFREGFEKAMKDGLPFLDVKEREALAEKYAEQNEKIREGLKKKEDDFGEKLKELLKGLKGLLDDD